jgi:hypothetical protein
MDQWLRGGLGYNQLTARHHSYSFSFDGHHLAR